MMKKTSLYLIGWLITTSIIAQEKKEIPSKDSVHRETALDSLALPVNTDTIPEKKKADSTDPSLDYYRINKRYFRSYWTDFKAVAAAPFHWKGKNWRDFALVTGTAGLFFAWGDEELRGVFRRNVNPPLDAVSEFSYPLGNRFPPLFLTGMYVTSIIFHDRRLEHTTLNVVRSLVISTIFYTASKTLIRRQRPLRSDDPHEFLPPFSEKNDYTSFPSGHTNTAFAVATAFTLEYPEMKWVPWVGYTLATMTALSRMYDDRHWASDLIIGASIGHFVTKTVYKVERKRMEERRMVVRY